MGRIFFNEDPNHFIYTRSAAGAKRITREDLVNFILQYKDTQVTDFLVCLNASLPFYNSHRTMNVMDRYKQWLAEGKTDENEADPIVRCVRLLVDIYENQGIEMHKLWIETLRSIGIRPWISIRMNDIHECTKEDSFLFSDFYQQNRANNRAAHRGASGYYEFGLDYMVKEIREHYLTVIGEALETFDVYGIELDFMREIYSIGIGDEVRGIEVMSAFMREVKSLVKCAEEQWGHRIQVGIRLPDTPEKCLRFGFDPFDYADAGLIDLITITPRWSSIDNNMPVDLWKRMLRGKPVLLAAGLEILIDAYNRRGRRYLKNTPETAIGSACAYLGMGADAIYLFNYMDAPTATDGDNSFLGDPEAYRAFLSSAGDVEASAARRRRHVVTYNDVYAIGASNTKQLPFGISGDGEHLPTFHALRIPTGPIAAQRQVRLVFGLQKGEGFAAASLTVYLNRKKCRLIGTADPQYPQYTDMEYYVFEAENDGTLPYASVAEIGITNGSATVHWAELDVD